MTSAPPPGDVTALADDERLSALARTGLLDITTDDALDRLTRLAARVLDAPVSLVSLVDAAKQHFASQVGLPAPWSERAQTPLSHSFCQHVVTSNAPLVVTDSLSDPRVADNLAIDDLGVHAYAGFPIVDDDGHVLGSFCVIDDTAREWSEQELETLSDIAAAAACEIKARTALRAAAARVQLLADVSLALQAHLDAGLALRALAERVVPALADVCLVEVAGEPLASGEAVRQAVDDALPSLLLDFPGGAGGSASEAVARVLAGGPCERLGDPVEVAVDGPGKRSGLGSVVVVPAASRSRVEAVLVLGRRAGTRAFDDDDVALAVEVGRRAGIALENGRLYAQERQNALALQQSLLPVLPALPGLELAAEYLPSSYAGKVGGDWYDVLSLPHGSIGIAVGDVAGHDLIAAAGMGQLRAVLRSYAWDDASPGSVLDKVCRLVRGLDEEQTATVFYGRLSPVRADGSRTLVYASAGHPPPVLRLADGSTRLLDAVVSPIIGVEVSVRGHAAVELPPGSTLLCYSDGLVERRGHDLDEGIAQLRALVAAARSTGVDELARTVVDEMTAWGHVDDDIAVLVLRTPEAAADA